MGIDFQILKRLYKSYTKNYLKTILLSVFFTLILAGSTSAVAYLLDPAIDQLFIKQNQKLLYILPGLIILAFVLKGVSLYMAKVLMISVSQDVKRDMQLDMFNSILVADTGLIDRKHSGKYRFLYIVPIFFLFGFPVGFLYFSYSLGPLEIP